MHSATSRFIRLLILPGILSIGLHAGAEVDPAPHRAVEHAGEPSSGPIHHRILWMHNPATQAVVSWSTTAEGSTHRVYYDTEPRGGDLDGYAYRADSINDGRFTMVEEDEGWSPPAYYHHVFLDELSPSTTYYLVMVSDDEVSREFHFITAPADDRPVKLLFGGDSRIGGRDPYDHEDRQAMNRRIAALFEAHPEVLALAHGGDYCQRAEWRYISPWLSDHELTTTSDGRLLPIIPARGNHDREIVFEEKFYWPGRDHDYYYATDLTPQITLLTLNTEISLGGDQREWLKEQLESLRPQRQWIMAQYHKPAFSSVRGAPDGESRRTNFVPLFEEYDIDLVLESHDHALKRTLPIRDAGHDPERGIVYIGDGGLGVPQRTPRPSRWYLQPPGFTMAVHHVHLLEFDEEQIRGRAFGMDGEVLDDFTIEPKAAPVAAGE